MKLKVKKYNDSSEYFIDFDKEKMSNDYQIASFLNLSYEKYTDILKKYNAYQKSPLYEFEFKNKKDAEEAIKELIPYLVMTTLTK